jgi:hypothetical protein
VSGLDYALPKSNSPRVQHCQDQGCSEVADIRRSLTSRQRSLRMLLEPAPQSRILRYRPVHRLIGRSRLASKVSRAIECNSIHLSRRDHLSLQPIAHLESLLVTIHISTPHKIFSGLNIAILPPPTKLASIYVHLYILQKVSVTSTETAQRPENSEIRLSKKPNSQ